jgi:prephenate dehydrogenase
LNTRAAKDAPDADTEALPGETLFKRLTIVGVGLIGGSLARALRRSGKRIEIVGYGRNHLNLQRALELGVIDRFETRLADAVHDADMVVVAVPVGATGRVLAEMREHLGAETIVTDVGSTKGSVIRAARAALGDALPAFVPGHPVAGNEQRGVEASTAGLFEDRAVLLTPLAETRPVAIARVRAMWQAAGARVIEMDAEHHDRILAATSHLPHVLAYTLVDTLARMDGSEEIFNYAAGGFRDFTRIASSDPLMWRDICVANRDAIIDALAQYRRGLDEVMKAIDDGDGEALMKLFERAKAVRDHVVKK